MQGAVAEGGAVPATIAVVDGEIRVGIDEGEIRTLAQSKDNVKIGVRDFADAAVRRASGGTTVAATLFAAKRAGIQVFATGGIGGVHKEGGYDISADLMALATTRIIVVCAGAKAILDLGATLEMLESLSVPVLGYRTNEFPAFYSRGSGLRTSARADSVQAIAQYWDQHSALGLESAVLVANPISEPDAIVPEELTPWVDQASSEAQAQGVRGQALTPFLLARIGELSKGRTIRANRALLLNNARLAGQIASVLAIPH